MKGYIAFCPHFHQPHFQLYKTREDVFSNSYEPWMDMLENAVKNFNDFHINIHLSGPFLYWIKQEKKEYLNRLKDLVKTSKVGLIGGFCDEAFIQLSSRVDDIYFQLKEYGDLLFNTLGVSFSDWQGIHIPERETGELLLAEISKASKRLGITPLYFLDSETFYEDYYSDIGGENDYCLKHLGFYDLVSKTTISRLPQDMLYFNFRDSIVGNEFYCFPMHSKYRYHLLKNNYFNEFDNVKIGAKEYFNMIKQDLIKANEYALKCGKSINPIAVIFEDAEKIGDWSKNPLMDTEWMNDFFKLVNEDEEISFIGLKDYYKSNSYFDTYPVSSSKSYPEWENWTAKRGVRGVVYSDEKLRKTISRLQLLERKQEALEKGIIDKLSFIEQSEIMKSIILDSSMRYSFIEKYLNEHYGKDISDKYILINRVRNVLYQEDSKWASRHPNYGSSPYFDNIGLSYLEIADRLLDELFKSCDVVYKNQVVKVMDWDNDGENEVFVTTKNQTLSIDMRGACIDYHIVLNGEASKELDIISSYNSIYKQAMPLVVTETDSDLKQTLSSNEERIEKCRNSYRCDVYNADDFSKIGDFSNALFELINIENCKDGINVICKTSQNVNGVNYEMTKKYIIRDNDIEVTIEVACDNKSINLLLVPQIVTSITSSDEVKFDSNSNISFENGQFGLSVDVEDKDNKVINWNGNLNYNFEINTGKGDTFTNSLEVSFDNPDLIDFIKIQPAVKNYYKGYVNDDQSKLNYNSSGIMVMPHIRIVNEIKIKEKWHFNSCSKE